ncbi:MAG: amidohydrolase family protein [Candidatus Dormibacteraceae bacterium]
MIDDHCHPFALEGGALDLANLSLDIDPSAAAAEQRHRFSATRLSQELMATRLARRLGCAVEELGEARAAAAADWRGYVSGLFAEVGFTALVMDPSYPPGAADRLSTYEDLSGCPVHALLRLEPTIDRMIGEGASTAEILDGLGSAMSAAAAAGRVGFKTVLAYRTGLAVDPDVSREAADASLLSTLPVRRRGKACRDHLQRRVLGIAAELGRPIQIHSGFGDSELRLPEANPLLLEDLLRTPEGAAAQVVLLHGSFPWHEEQAYLALTKPNVWADFSLSNIYSPTTTADRLMRILDLAPAAKVLAATDGYHEPETFWFAGLVLREAWQVVEDRLEAAGARRSWIDQVSRMVLEENARRLYGI